MLSRKKGERTVSTRKRASQELTSKEKEQEGETYEEQPKKIPVFARCEVLVVGGGPSGLSAAVGAARAGADVMLVEKFGCFGGVITTVGMETLGWYRYEGTVDCEGIGREFERRGEAMQGGAVKWPYNGSPCLDADHFKVIADEMIRENNIRPLLHTLVVETIMEGDTIKGVITESKSGRQAIFADRVIDCTGDADVTHLAGGRYWRVPREKNMGVTMVFGCSGVDKQKFEEYTEKNPATYADWSVTWPQTTAGKENHLNSPYLEQQFLQAEKEGLYKKEKNVSIGGSWSALTDAGEATNLNLVHLSRVDCCNAEELTNAEMEGRKQVLNAIAALKQKVPGFENAKLRTFGMQIGTRDSRKIYGKYNLTKDDVAGQAKFPDSIGVFPEFIDGYSILILPTTGRYFQVPYGCCVPADVNNLLVGGRCVAGDMASHAAMRNMMACTVTGQGAGVAAAISVKTNKSTRDVDVKLVQEELLRQGVKIF
eukprot:CAMPEP_0201517770 /NCGR_PEP_ID=MMETSP0161_2-20130828/8804_1 /ASSEMBLY_ACC=CAM_ASM_000251 /TAXON_ID=180227 /ORGANISM="Neoparamoeba aestuarina, Strain SoJaBio B1-5/56/2" /LENGTH=483 /DNA_ID=CAMNT_0047915381 /DNA_START=210 /DNA_END=1661 /DNA_ORIENTATION=+